MRELSKKSTIYFSNRQVTFQIDWISSQNENFLVVFRNCQIESKTCQLFFSVFIMCATFLNPAKFSILVIHLLLPNSIKFIMKF
jgi:hypothetical protein